MIYSSKIKLNIYYIFNIFFTNALYFLNFLHNIQNKSKCILNFISGNLHGQYWHFDYFHLLFEGILVKPKFYTPHHNCLRLRTVFFRGKKNKKQNKTPKERNLTLFEHWAYSYQLSKYASLGFYFSRHSQMIWVFFNKTFYQKFLIYFQLISP